MSDLLSRGQKRDDGTPAESNGQAHRGSPGRATAGSSPNIGNLSGGELQNGAARPHGRVSDIGTEEKIK